MTIGPKTSKSATLEKDCASVARILLLLSPATKPDRPYCCSIMTTELGRTARIAHNVSLKWHPFVTPDPFVNSAP